MEKLSERYLYSKFKDYDSEVMRLNLQEVRTLMEIVSYETLEWTFKGEPGFESSVIAAQEKLSELAKKNGI